MELDSPIFVDNLNDVDLTDPKKCYITKKSIDVNNLDDKLIAIFNLPDNLFVIIDGLQIPCDVFDYYNPLLLNKRIISKIQFMNYKGKVERFDCLQFYNTYLETKSSIFETSTIHYTSDIFICYSNVKVFYKGLVTLFYLLLKSIHYDENKSDISSEESTDYND